MDDNRFFAPLMLGKAEINPLAYGCLGSLKIASVSASSTIFPAYITAVFSHMSAMVDMSWDINMNDR